MVLVGYFLGSVPIIASAIAQQLPAYVPSMPASVNSGTLALIVLSGDNPRGRAVEASKRIQQLSPECVVVSGTGWFVRHLVQAGVSESDLVVDRTAETTRDQIARLPIWAEQCQAHRVVLVASRISMPRIAGLLRDSPLPIALAPAPLDVEPIADGFRAAVPSYSSLRLTRDALYEHAALLYYRHKRWIR